jgi:hypothetical protein
VLSLTIAVSLSIVGREAGSRMSDVRGCVQSSW